MTESKKAQYRIGDISRQLNIPAYVLRYWESEFSELKPYKSDSGQRYYTQQDIEIIKKIAQLRYQEKLTLSGTKRKLRSTDPATNSNQSIQTEDLKKSLLSVKNCLQEILSALR
jgi:DNA-binding transcriptional MerR regulator